MKRLGRLAALLPLVAVGWVVPATASAAVGQCHGVKATIVGDSSSEHLIGTPHRDVIAARGGNDTVDGLGGDDLICGGSGHDRLTGGAGDDVLYGGSDWRHRTDEGDTERIGDLIDPGPGDDSVHPGRDARAAADITPDIVTWATARRGVHIDLALGTATGAGHDRIFGTGTGAAVVGSEFADVILGSEAADRIEAGRGADEVRARGGDDIVSADPRRGDHGSKDRVRGGAGDDQLSALGGDDLLRGGTGDDVLDDYGTAADRLYGGPGNDLIVTELVRTTTAQVVNGGPGADRANLMTNQLNPDARPATGTWNMATGELELTLDDDPIITTVLSIEDAHLSTYGTAWTVTGSDKSEVLQASGTRGTTFTALGGDDQFSGSDHDDTFDGGDGTDRSLAMGAGIDTCRDVEIFDYPDCEVIS
jgi:Ca2+-binding RTX toxin-like protein